MQSQLACILSCQLHVLKDMNGSFTHLKIMLLQSHLFPIIQQFSRTEVETPNNFWPFRFLKGVLIFILFQIANLNEGGMPWRKF